MGFFWNFSNLNIEKSRQRVQTPNHSVFFHKYKYKFWGHPLVALVFVFFRTYRNFALWLQALIHPGYTSSELLSSCFLIKRYLKGFCRIISEECYFKTMSCLPHFITQFSYRWWRTLSCSLLSGSSSPSTSSLCPPGRSSIPSSGTSRTSDLM